MPRWSSFDGAADRRLVQGLNDGDRTSLAALYDAYAERLFDYCVSMTGEYKTAVEIVHDTFIDAWRRAPRMRDQMRLGSWLYAAARRRCLQRGRARQLHWEAGPDFADALPADCAEDAGARPEPPPVAELAALLERSLARLDAADQELLLLSVRHGLRPADIGAALGLSARRAAARTRRARSLLHAAYEAEQALYARRCPGAGRAGEAAATGGAHAAVAERPAAARRHGGRSRRAGGVLTARRSSRSSAAVASRAHSDGDGRAHHGNCPACRRRRRVEVGALLVHAPSPVLPAALRHRVMHTATDPELAGYRTDIAARGGALTPDGMPSQPDVPSPYTRRWLFAGGGMAGALVTALVAALLIGPGLPPSTISWPPFRTHPQPAVTPDRQNNEQPHTSGQSGGRPPLAQAPAAPGVPAVPSPQPTDTGTYRPAPTPSPTSPVSPSPTPTTPETPPSPGIPTVVPAKVELYGTKTAQVRLTAENGPVVWNSVSSSDRISVSPAQGSLEQGDSIDLTVTLHTTFLNPPGEGTVTFLVDEGPSRKLDVVWGFYLI
ncbi:sigma-70 family RNA polymerase sigma factor [Actinomadura keratinilytica]|jgi:RNA polymerase sigma factor (sigma-70 family)